MPRRFTSLTQKEQKTLNASVEEFIKNKKFFETTARNLYNNLGEFEALKPLVHSLKYRIKEPDHLREKLKRKVLEAKNSGKTYKISPANIFEEVQDLAGVRLLHLHTSQVPVIDKALRCFFEEQAYELIEGPVANTWDIEYSEFFASIGMESRSRNTLYTSIHYVVGANDRAKTRCEIQVRTLMEEVWGEVSHTIDYPSPTDSVACKEQLKVLARVTSSGTRLVDSIFKSHDEYANCLSSTGVGFTLKKPVQLSLPQKSRPPLEAPTKQKRSKRKKFAERI